MSRQRKLHPFTPSPSHPFFCTCRRPPAAPRAYRHLAPHRGSRGTGPRAPTALVHGSTPPTIGPCLLRRPAAHFGPERPCYATALSAAPHPYVLAHSTCLCGSPLLCFLSLLKKQTPRETESAAVMASRGQPGAILVPRCPVRHQLEQVGLPHGSAHGRASTVVLPHG